MLRKLKALYKYIDKFLTILSLVDASRHLESLHWKLTLGEKSLGAPGTRTGTRVSIAPGVSIGHSTHWAVYLMFRGRFAGAETELIFLPWVTAPDAYVHVWPFDSKLLAAEGNRFANFKDGADSDDIFILFLRQLRHTDAPVSYTHLTLPTMAVV